ncbi:MAG: choice-of-anchor A family protein [Lachnospirales bacterium]
MYFEELENISLFVSKDCDLVDSTFCKGIIVGGSLNVKNTIIEEYGVQVNERSKIFYNSINNECVKVVSFSSIEKLTYNVALKSIELQECKNLGVGVVKDFSIYLKGNNSQNNVFTFLCDNIYDSDKGLSDILEIFIEVPLGSKIIINVIGHKVVFSSIDIFFWGENLSFENFIDITWNFPETSLFICNFVKAYGCFLVPFGKCKFKKTLLYGKLIGRSISGNIEIYNIFAKNEDKDCFNDTYENLLQTSCKKKVKIVKNKNVKEHKGKVSKKQAYNDVIESIALEEKGLANILMSESLKVEKALELACNTEDLIKINKSVKKTLAQISHNQMLLQYKLCEVKDILDK